MNEKLTFRQLEGPRADAAQEAGDSPLELWYERVRDQSVDGFSDEDLETENGSELYCWQPTNRSGPFSGP